jgi:rhamnose utilization protein RhaD (predicted bifunctional aldolase and dehydrogenase)
MESLRSELVSLGHHLGEEIRDYVILGEGNISGKDNEYTFLVKSSGTSLKTLTEKDLVEVWFEDLHTMLRQKMLSDEEISKGLAQACVDPDCKSNPSVETFLHAILLQVTDINFIGHTHPTAVNSILCSQHGAEAFSSPLFPDQIVYCGPAVVFVPYTDPGLPLALRVREEVDNFITLWGISPKVILLENHGFIALGSSIKEVQNITAMGVKVARVILGAYAAGGLKFLSEQAVKRIHKRPDEKYRKEAWGMQ